MAAKGAVSKEKIIEQILSQFDGAFRYDKEIRIPMIEDGVEVQIKVTLTCAKTNVDRGDDTALPGAKPTVNKTVPVSASASTTSLSEPTEDEKKNIKELIEKLGIE